MSPQKVAMPQSLEVERSVLGMMVANSECAIEGMAQLKPEDFSDQRTRLVFEACCELERRGKPIDTVILYEMLHRHSAFEENDDCAVYLSDMSGELPFFYNMPHYIAILKDKTMLRQLISAAQSTIKEATSTDGQARNIIDRAEHRVLQIGEQYINKDFVGLNDLVDRSVETLDALRQGLALTGIPTGFPTLDQLTTGLHSGEMAILAARPGVGKTSMALDMALHIARYQNKCVGIFSMEMNHNQLMQRMIHSASGITAQAVSSGMLSERQWIELKNTAMELKRLPVFIDDSAALTPIEIRAKARRLKHRNNLSVVFIDYLQLMHSEARTENRQQEVTRISSDLKALAKDLDIVVVALSQLSRRATNHPGPPHLGDLRESGSIEQDADLVMFLYDPRAEARGNESDLQREVMLRIAKQRNGPTGEIALVFNSAITSFQERDGEGGAFVASTYIE